MNTFFKKNFKKLLFLSLLTFTFYHLYNLIRVGIFYNSPVIKSALILDNSPEEGSFRCEIYKCKRVFNSNLITTINRFSNDKLLVVYLPSGNFRFKNLIIKPKGNDKLSGNADFYFNSVMFGEDFTPVNGFIYNKRIKSQNYPAKTKIGIHDNGTMEIFSHDSNSLFNDVIQPKNTFNISSKVDISMRRLNYGQFISQKNGSIIYITGYGNSLISWSDIKSLMLKLQLPYVLHLDGGASLDYYFRGSENTYSFSSIPFRNLWFTKNSPYYIEGYRR